MNDVQNLKDMMIFFDIINNLPAKKERVSSNDENVKIPVILSSDVNYSCFIATTGASILYNTNSFIEFYILSDGISEKNKSLINETFKSITHHFSINFIEVNADEHFSQIKLEEGYHVKLNTCNRLLFPLLAPNVDRAIYLDVDLIVLDDIKKLWEIDLEGHVFGAVPLFIDRASTIEFFKQQAKISLEEKYPYFNSGVLVVDYSKWRQLKGSNDNIINDLFHILKDIKTNLTPDEVILNKFAYLNNGYKILQHKYNVGAYYSYLWLKNQKELSSHEKSSLYEFNRCITANNYKSYINIEKPFIRHFMAHEKPWLFVASEYFPIPLMDHLKEFWFYTSITPYFEDIKNKFLYKHMVIENKRDIETRHTTKLYKNIFQRIFSVKNLYVRSKKFKVITILGIKIKYQKRRKN